jgi:hypothetical protein
MSEVITTTANRVKNGGFWCEDATEITQAALTKDGLTWDEEIPVAWGFDALGLANTILSLGSVRPRFQGRADRTVISLMKRLYSMAADLGSQLDPPFFFTDVRHWLGNPDRVNARRSQYEMWKQMSPTHPGAKAIVDAMTILFSTEPNHVICIHASKLLLYATMDMHGELVSKEARKGIIDFLRQELINE